MNAINSIPGFNVLLLGETGTGKTYSIRSLIECGITPFVVFTEPGMRTLSDIPDDHLHWHYVPPATPSWDKMIDSANKINTLSFEALSKLPGINKTEYNQFKEVLGAFSNFTCSRCNRSFGDVTTWGTDRALVVDSLSGLNIMALDLVVGSKPTKSMADWGVAMDNLERLINKLCADTQCHFILTAHIEREFDEITGAIKLMVGTLGKKLAPRMPRFFDDVVMTLRDETKFRWSNTNSAASLKSRNLMMGDNLPPSFVTLVESWKKAGGIISLT